MMKSHDAEDEPQVPSSTKANDSTSSNEEHSLVFQPIFSHAQVFHSPNVPQLSSRLMSLISVLVMFHSLTAL